MQIWIRTYFDEIYKLVVFFGVKRSSYRITAWFAPFWDATPRRSNQVEILVVELPSFGAILYHVFWIVTNSDYEEFKELALVDCREKRSSGDQLR